MSINYKQAGVDIGAGEAFVARLQSKVGITYNADVVSGVGGYASLYRQGDGFLCSSTDGVGTKLILAQDLGQHHTIGEDLVAMCVNDLLCVGARPLFFLDYFALGELSENVADEVIAGVIRGCEKGEMALIGGETAEMPGLYARGRYDLAGFCVGQVQANEVITGEKVEPGQALVGILSSGFHSNGYSLLRKMLKYEGDNIASEDLALARELLTPTKIYVSAIARLIANCRQALCGIAHITGSGFHNIRRMNEKYTYQIDHLPTAELLPAVFSNMTSRLQLSQKELLSTFNMGIGMVIATTQPQKIIGELESMGECAMILGQVTAQGRPGEVVVNCGGEGISLMESKH